MLTNYHISLRSITLSVFLAVLMTLMGFMPQLAKARTAEREIAAATDTGLARSLAAGMLSPVLESVISGEDTAQTVVPPAEGGGGVSYAPLPQNGLNIDTLIAVSDNLTDTDSDTIPDAVERIIGTSANSTDTDMDELDDYYEAKWGLDPLKPDSNDDGLIDYLEIVDNSVADYARDLDGDGTPNVWDDDNDNDGVTDGLDLSPFRCTTADDTMELQLYGNGNPTYIDFQLVPEDESHLKLPPQVWDWPDDNKGQITDVDGSKEDVTIQPYLEWSLQSPYSIPWLPSVEDADDYGIIVSEGEDYSDDSAYVPLSAVQDLGTNVALTGRLFLPSPYHGTSYGLPLEARLVWMVTAQVDAISFQLNSESLKVISGYSSSITPGEGWMKLPMNLNFGAGGRYIYLCVNANIANDIKVIKGTSPDISPDEGWTKIDKNLNEGTGVGYYVYICVKGELVDRIQVISGDSPDITPGEGWTKINKNLNEGTGVGDYIYLCYKEDVIYETQSNTVARYYEDYRLTGFNVIENYGAEVGLFYSDNVDTTSSAYVALRYEFLNSQNPLAEAPDRLAADNVTVSYQLASSDHFDGILGVSSNLTKGIVDSFPDGQYLPITYAFQDIAVEQSMDRFGSDEGYNNIDHHFYVYITHPVANPPVTTRSLKLAWYDTDTDTMLETEDLIDMVLGWNWPDDETENAIKLAIVLNAGESKINKVGTTETHLTPPDAPETLSYLKKGTGILKQIVMLPAYIHGLGFFLVAWKAAGWSAKSLITVAKASGDFYKIVRGVNVAPGGIKRIESLIGPLGKNWVGKLSKFSKIAKGLKVLGMVTGVAMIGYAFFQMASQSGWSKYGVSLAAAYAGLMLGYMILLELVALIPIVGAVIAGIVVLSDLIVAAIFGKGWSDMLIDWLVEWMVGKPEITVLSEVDYEILDSSLDIDDNDANGLDAGDMVTYTTWTKSTIKKTSDGSMYDVRYPKSFIFPWVYFNHDFNTAHAQTLEETEFSDRIERSDKAWTTYTPQKAKINLPLVMVFSVSYQTRYKECIKDDCEKKSNYGNITDESQKFYFDIMPGTIGDFAGWKEITALDPDGDGLLTNGEFEINSDNETVNSKPFVWDTDADGLNDKYEDDIGTNPRLSDSDRDGLNDGLEARLGTDPLNYDTDGDGLNDNQEYQGWKLYIYYGGQTFVMTTHPDPTAVDTDGDGLSDSREYVKGLNPCSVDTDGDNIYDPDEIVETTAGYLTSIDFNGKGSTLKAVPGEIINATIGYTVTGTTYPGTDNVSTRCILKAVTEDPRVEYTIYDGTPAIAQVVTGNTTFQFQAPVVEDIYTVRFYAVWSYTGAVPPFEYLEIIGAYDTTDVLYGPVGWSGTGDDSDGDGLIDVNEVLGWNITFTGSEGVQTEHIPSNPKRTDSDGDGLDDYEEYTLLTNASDIDTDGDGLDDKYEVDNGLNPLLADMDSDELLDGLEVSLGTNLLNSDTDGDGESDGQEFNGWVFNYTYEGQPYTKHVTTDPLVYTVFEPIIEAGGPYSVREGNQLTLSVDGEDAYGTPLTYEWDLDDDGTFETAEQYPVFSTDNIDGPGVVTVSVKATGVTGLTGTSVTTVTVVNVGPITDAGPDITANLGVVGATFDGNFLDPGSLDTHTIVWDFGDGETATGNLTPTHHYASSGNYTATLTVTDDDGASSNDTVEVMVGHLNVTNFEETEPGEYTVYALGEVGVEVIKSGSGTPGIGIGKWLCNPGDGGYPAFLVVGGYFIDVYLDSTDNVDQIEIRYHYEDDDVAGLVESSLNMQWWNGTGWVPCSDSGVNTDENYVWVRVTSDTSPSLADMVGTPFCATGERMPVIPSLSEWGTLVLMLLLAAAVIRQIKRRNDLEANRGIKIRVR